MTVSDEGAWRPACGDCGSTSLTPAPDGYRCASCGTAWDGSEAPEPVPADAPLLPICLEPDRLADLFAEHTRNISQKGNP